MYRSVDGNRILGSVVVWDDQFLENMMEEDLGDNMTLEKHDKEGGTWENQGLENLDKEGLVITRIWKIMLKRVLGLDLELKISLKENNLKKKKKQND